MSEHHPAFDEPDTDGAAAFAQEMRRDIRPVPRITIQAFCETHETASAFESASEDRRMARAHVKVQTGGIDAAVEFYRESSTPNVVVLESVERKDKLLAALGRFAEVCDPSSRVVVIGHVNDIGLYRELMRQGVSEYVVAPVSTLDVVEVVSKLYSDANAKPVGRIVAFVGAKGGVGASTIAHNTAWYAANELQTDTLVLDLDLAFGTANLNFNTDPPQGVAEAVFSPDRLDQTFLDRIMASCGERLNLLAASATLDRTYDFGEGAFEQLMDVVRNNAPLIVLDVPHVWTAWARRTLIAADDIVIVATPDLANLRNAKNLADLLKASRPHDPAPKLVLNPVGVAKRPEISAADFAKAIDLKAEAIVPFDAQLFGTAANNGQMLAEVAKSSKVVEAVKVLAERITDRAPPKKPRGLASSLPVLEKLQGLMTRKRA
jgi:pilus assembly protein CpaE